MDFTSATPTSEGHFFTFRGEGGGDVDSEKGKGEYQKPMSFLKVHLLIFMIGQILVSLFLLLFFQLFKPVKGKSAGIFADEEDDDDPGRKL